MKKTGKKLKWPLFLAAAFVLAAAGLVLSYFFPLKKVEKSPGLINATGSPSYSNANRIAEDNIHNNEYIVVWQEDVSQDERTRLVSDLEHFTVSEEFDGIYMLVRCTSLPVSDAVSQLESIEGVEIAEPNYVMTPESLDGDAYGNGLWALDNNGFYDYFDIAAGSSTTLPIHKDIDINFPEAKALYPSVVPAPEPVVVAIIDTGVDIEHPELAGHIWVNEGEIPDDGIDNDNNGYVDDIYGWDFYNNDNTVIHRATDVDGVFLDNDNHGTKIAGIIAASAENGVGIAGTASFAPVKIMVVKMNGGSRSYGTVANAIKAVNYATSMGADICNMSWGIQKSGKNDTSASLDSLKTAMVRSDMLFVCAAGNTGTDNDEYPVYPASFNLQNSISVTWCDQFGKLIASTETSREGSNYGKNSVDIAAPGVYVLSTVVGGGYAPDSGSSLAAPYVSGIAAVLMSTGKNFFPAEIKDLILSTRKQVPADDTDYSDPETTEVNPFADMADKIKYPGIPDLYAALASAAGTLFPDTDAPELKIDRTFEGDVIVLSVSGKDLLSGIRTIRYALETSETDTANMAFFLRGVSGTAYTEALRLAKGGVYSFYASDYAGNEVLVRYILNDDTTAPKIDLLGSFTSPSGTNLAVLDVSDYESGLAKFLLLPGELTPEQFAEKESEAAVLRPYEDRLLLRLNGAGPHTLYAIDHRGNVEVYILKQE